MAILIRILRRALLVGLIAVLAYVGILFVLCKVKVGANALVYRSSDVYNLKGGNTYRKFLEYDPAAHYDVIVIGSSHAYRGYDPRIFREAGISMFNLGTSGQTPVNTYAILKEYITKANTGMVLLDCYENAMGMEGLESAADLSQNITSDAAVLRMFAAIHDPRILNMFTIRKIMANEPAAYVDSFYVDAGFSTKTDSVKGVVDYGLDLTLELGEGQPEYLVRCIRYCQELGIPILLVTHPLPHAGNHPRHAAFHNVIDSVAKATEVEYMDYAFDHGLPLDDRNHFYDHNHFNQAGVAIFNPKLIADLRAKGYFSQ
ncbi:MAG: hypothetical protein ABI599_04405 [Flavobacteriales bacterium]